MELQAAIVLKHRFSSMTSSSTIIVIILVTIFVITITIDLTIIMVIINIHCRQAGGITETGTDSWCFADQRGRRCLFWLQVADVCFVCFFSLFFIFLLQKQCLVHSFWLQVADICSVCLLIILLCHVIFLFAADGRSI